MRTYYCTECDWFNQIAGRSGIGGSRGVEWHLIKKHLVFELPSKINEKIWNRKNIIQKLRIMLDGRQLEPLAQDAKWEPEDDEDKELEAVETCIHDWEFQYMDVLKQLKTGEKELIRSKCKNCGTARVQGPAEKVKEVYQGPAEISILGQGILRVHSGNITIVEDSQINDLVVEHKATVNLEADLNTDNLEIEGKVNGLTSTITVNGTLNNRGTLNV